MTHVPQHLVPKAERLAEIEDVYRQLGATPVESPITSPPVGVDGESIPSVVITPLLSNNTQFD